MPVDLSRFHEAQEEDYTWALEEIKRGSKESHWMWYIFPQLAGLGQSSISQFYAIRNLAEAKAYLDDPVLGSRLIEISTVLIDLPYQNARQIFGSPDDLKLRSCMTLFTQVENSHPVFRAVLEKYFGGKPDPLTIQLLAK